MLLLLACAETLTDTAATPTADDAPTIWTWRFDCGDDYTPPVFPSSTPLSVSIVYYGDDDADGVTDRVFTSVYAYDWHSFDAQVYCDPGITGGAMTVIY